MGTGLPFASWAWKMEGDKQMAYCSVIRDKVLVQFNEAICRPALLNTLASNSMVPST